MEKFKAFLRRKGVTLSLRRYGVDALGAMAQGVGTCGFVGQIGIYTGWVADVASGAKAAITGFDVLGLVLICFVLPAILCAAFGALLRRMGWIGENDLKLDL